MKKLSIYSMLLAGLMAFASCEADRDSNPVLQEPTEFVLNTPAYVNSVYDLSSSKSIELTCSQPNFGYTAPTIYGVEVSLTQDFANSITLDTKYTTAKMAVDASEMALAFTNLWVAEGKLEEDFPMTSEFYVRVVAQLSSASGTIASITSNVVKLPTVRSEFALPPVKLPTELYLIGGFCDWAWASAPAMVLTVDGTTGTFWRMVYLPANSGFKFNTATAWDGGEKGFAQVTVKDNAGAGTKDDGGNIGVTNGGWYLVVVRSEVNGRDIAYTVEMNKPEVWLIGGCVTDGKWDELLEGWMFSVPETADGYFVSPAFAQDAAEGPRAYVKIDGYDWWKSEFMVFDKKLTYRGAGGDLERISTKAGQKMYLNFTNDTGKIE